MTDETRRRQKREELMTKAQRIIEADKQRRLENIKSFIEARRSLKGAYSPERCAAQLRALFGGKHRKAIHGEE